MHDKQQRITEWFLRSEQRDQVRGYLQDTQARAIHILLSQQLSLNIQGSLAEIGVFCGKTLIGLARAARASEPVVGVDPLMIGNQDLLPELTQNLKTYLTADELTHLTLKRAFSTKLDVLEWVRTVKQAPRFVHLDGHHARETILHDVQLAASWLPKGAVVVFDDFLNELHPDLTSGILDGLTAHPQLQPLAVIPRMGHIEEGGSKLVCVTRGDGDPYLQALDRALADHLRPWNDRMLGADVRVYRSIPPRPIAPVRPQPKQDASPLPVVFALHDPDGSYWLNTAVAITSAAEHASRPLSITVLHDETLTPPARRRLEQIGRDLGTELTLRPVQLPKSVALEHLRQFSAASVFRLLIPQMFADEDAVVYLDSDLVVNGLDIHELAAAAPPSAPLSAVRDPHIARAESHAKELESMALDAATYFNSGVLVLRPRLLQEQDLLEAFTAFSATYPGSIHPDQNFLNLRFRGVAHLLDGRFNYQVSAHEQTLLQPLKDYRGKILHYAGKIKPLDGSIAPAMIPFWAHAHRVPEITQGALYNPTRYLLPIDGEPNALKVQKLS